jgi:hypothetical protein
VLLWAFVALAAVLALAALGQTRRLGRRLDTLTQSYWELRYDYTRLRSQVARLDPGEPADAEPGAPPAPAPSVSFVPLASIRKKDPA